MPARSAAKFALASGASAGALTLGVVAVPSLIMSMIGAGGSFDAGPVAAQAAAVACATTVLAAAEERAARSVGRGHVVRGLASILPVALVAALIAVAHAAWATAMQEQGPDAAPSLALKTLSRLDRGQWEAMALAALLPTAVAMTRAACALTPGARVAIGAATMMVAYATIFLAPEGLKPRPNGAEVQALGAGIVYFLGALLGDWFVPERGSSTLPLHDLVLPFLIPVGVCHMLQKELGPLATLPVLAWVVYQATQYKRAALRTLPTSGPDDGVLPTWFSESALAGVDEDLRRHCMRRVATHGRPDGTVQAIAIGNGPTLALIFQAAPVANVTAAPTVVFFTAFRDGHAVMTTGHAFDALSWLGRSPLVVVDAVPGAEVDDLMARHFEDVAALAALAGPPTGPGSVESYRAQEAESSSALTSKVRAVPALWLLACAWWFNAPRPVRLRGPLPA